MSERSERTIRLSRRRFPYRGLLDGSGGVSERSERTIRLSRRRFRIVGFLTGAAA